MERIAELLTEQPERYADVDRRGRVLQVKICITERKRSSYAKYQVNRSNNGRFS